MSAVYENPEIVAEYLLFHYGSEEEILPRDLAWPEGMRAALGFAVRTPSHFGTSSVRRGLDLGCAVGRSTYEMSRICDQVVGMDFSDAFIKAANELRENRPIAYARRDEGHRRTQLEARLPKGIDASRVSFFQGDAMALPEDLGVFDRVHAANLLCRLSNPVRLLERLPLLVTQGGELVLATPCTWLADFTPPELWPNGDTFDWLWDHLGGAFELIHRTDEPFLIRETARKFQWTRSMVTVWRRF